MKLVDPPRLFDALGDASDPLRDMLAAARRDLPGPDRIDRVADAVAAHVVPPPPPPGAATAATAATAPVAGASASAAAKAAAIAAIVTAAAFAAWSAAPTPRATTTTTATATATATATTTATATATTTTTTTATTTPTDVPTVDVNALPRASATLPDPSATRGEELRLLTAAQDALAHDPARALALAEEHARRHPAGALAQEREVLAIDALARAGRRDEAEARAARFRARYPGSASAPRIETILGR